MPQTPQFLDVSQYRGVTIAQLLEERLLEPPTIADTSTALRALVDNQGTPLILLDFSRVTRFSSAALGMVVELHQHVRNRGGHLCLANITPQIGEVFRITRLDEVLNMAASNPEGVALLKRLAEADSRP